MNTRSLPVRWAGLTIESVAVLLLANGISPISGSAQTATIVGSAPPTGVACNPAALVSSLVGWLKNPYPGYDNKVTAVLASNRPPHLLEPLSESQVTYAKIELSAGTGFSNGWLLTDKPGQQYFNDRLWGEKNPDPNPNSQAGSSLP
jgi:hypothetical protein